MKKLLVFGLVLCMAAMLFIGCETKAVDTGSEAQQATQSEAPAQPDAQEESNTTVEGQEIVMISKMYQNPWYQVAYNGAGDAAAEYGFKLTTTGPSTGSNIQEQVDQVSAAVNRKPYALIIDAIEASSLSDAMAKAVENNVAVIAFDGPLPGYDNVLCTIATDNVAAGALAADKLFEEPGFKEAVSKGTVDNPVVIGGLSEDGTSSTLIDRLGGFVNQISANIQTMDGFKDAVEITGGTQWAKASAQPAKVTIITSVPPAATQADNAAIASTMLSKSNLIAIFANNNATVDGLLSATSDGLDLDKETGKYKDLYAIGFDAGATLKAAVKSKQFLGAITQDPYSIGYNSVKAAYDYSQGATLEDQFPAAIWWNYENMDNPDVAKLLYD